MDKSTVGLLGALAGLAAIGSAQAASNPAPNPAKVLQASSYADLLAPVSNPVEVLIADDLARAQVRRAAGQKRVQDAADYNGGAAGNALFYRKVDDHHHHHHHHHHHNNNLPDNQPD